MKKFFNRVINENGETKRWYNKNYFYVTTFVFSLGMIIGFLAFHDQINHFLDNSNSIFRCFVQPFSHSKEIPYGMHLITNLVNLWVCALLLERHFGSFCFFLILFMFIPLADLICIGSGKILYGSYAVGEGESHINCLLLGFMLMVVIFNYKKYLISKQSLLFYIPIIFTIVDYSMEPNASMSGVKSFYFLWSLFVYNQPAHMYPFLSGLVIGLVVNAIVLFSILDKKNKKKKIVKVDKVLILTNKEDIFDIKEENEEEKKDVVEERKEEHI